MKKKKRSLLIYYLQNILNLLKKNENNFAVTKQIL